ncbi:MAG: T9SS type A sorting domain-containing protein [Chitinophagales bacterium]
MKKITLLFVFIFNNLNAQNFNYFNKLINPDSTNVLTNCVLPVEDGYLTAGVLGSTGTYTAIYLSKIDLNGDFQWLKIIDEDSQVATIGSGNSFIKDAKNPEHFVLMYGKYQNAEITDLGVALVKFDKEGNILWQRLHGDEYRQAPYTLINAHDGGYLVSGWQQINANPFTFYALKLDSLGQEQWHNTYTLSSEGSSNAGFAIATEDGGYLLSSYGYHPQTDMDMYMVKISSRGTVEWEKNHGSAEEDSGCQITEYLNQEGYFLSGRKWRFGDSQNYFAQLDSAGNIVWDKHYHIKKASTFRIRYTPQSNLIGFSHFLNENYLFNPILASLNLEGDTLWTKPITPDPNNDVYVRDLEATPDGGYIIAGFNYTHTPQYGWIAKIDSLGNTCWELGCDSTAIATNIDHIPTHNPYQVKISPNPVRDRATVSYHLPLDGRLQLFNLSGALVRQFYLPAYFEALPLDVSSLQGGLYIYKVSIEGREVSSGKLVVE